MSRVLHELRESHGLSRRHGGGEVGARALGVFAGAVLFKVTLLGAVVVVLLVVALAGLEVDLRAKVVLDLVETNLLLVLDIALVVRAVGVRAGLVADDEVDHLVGLEEVVRVEGDVLPTGEAPVGLGCVALAHGSPRGSRLCHGRCVAGGRWRMGSGPVLLYSDYLI